VAETEPTNGMQAWQSKKTVLAGRIVEIVEAGCYVENALEGVSHLRLYDEGMTARYTPTVGDYWVIYEDGYQAISPKTPFEAGYDRVPGVIWGNPKPEIIHRG
jgi:hypothetical protein